LQTGLSCIPLVRNPFLQTTGDLQAAIPPGIQHRSKVATVASCPPSGTEKPGAISRPGAIREFQFLV